MASERRREQIKLLIKEELSKILDRGFEFPAGCLVTITRVVMSDDSQYATIFISILGAVEAKEVIKILRKGIYDIQQSLNRKLRMRPIPKIRFAVDEDEVRREGFERSLAQIKREGELL